MGELDYKAIGKRIREARKAQKLTQEEAAERCDITSSFYGNVERGDKKMSLETLAKISRGLSVSTDVLLFGSSASDNDILTQLQEELRRSKDEKQVEKYLLIIRQLSKIIDQL
ncbi:MAG: helix-turn-helix domain-containing protein [Lachnospiraceae bacterium]|nr:helix-turn-helix domain-containing protein [Lachnospiraceae bacterium]